MRYQQFHFPHKAAATKAKIERLYREVPDSVASIAHVLGPGAEPMDGDLLFASIKQTRDIDINRDDNNNLKDRYSVNESTHGDVYGGLILDNNTTHESNYQINNVFFADFNKFQNATPTICYARRVLLAVSSRRYVERMLELKARKFALFRVRRSLFEGEEERERLKRFHETKSNAMINIEKQKNHQRSDYTYREELTANAQGAAVQARKWLSDNQRGLVSIDGRNYDDLQRAPIHTYKSNFSLFAREHIANGLEYDPSIWLRMEEEIERNRLAQEGGNKRDDNSKNDTDEIGRVATPSKIVDLFKEMQRQSISASAKKHKQYSQQMQSSPYGKTPTSTQTQEQAQARTQYRKPTPKITANLHAQSASVMTFGNRNADDNSSNNDGRVYNEFDSSVPSAASSSISMTSTTNTNATPNKNQLHNDSNSNIISPRKLEFGGKSPLLTKKALQKLVRSPAGASPVIESGDHLRFSPTLLTKRHQQALFAIQQKRWDELENLLTANKWLAEMTDILSGQLLLHQIALHGAGAPIMLINSIYDYYPNGVHKFDNHGNLPLHMACSAGNAHMVTLLLVHFESGSSVRNNDGLLPLHFAVVSGALEIVERLLLAFPAGTAVMDNDGNLPLHFAASLEGPLGRSMVNMLLNEDVAVLVDNVKRMNLSSHHVTSPVDDKMPGSASYISSGLVKNTDLNTPLMVAIQALSGWEVIEALLEGQGGEKILTLEDDHFSMRRNL